MTVRMATARRPSTSGRNARSPGAVPASSWADSESGELALGESCSRRSSAMLPPLLPPPSSTPDYLIVGEEMANPEGSLPAARSTGPSISFAQWIVCRDRERIECLTDPHRRSQPRAGESPQKGYNREIGPSTGSSTPDAITDDCLLRERRVEWGSLDRLALQTSDPLKKP